jgi:hypothetical protein
MPFGLGKCVILWYIEVALGFVGVNVIGFVGCVYTLERFKVCRPSSVVCRLSSVVVVVVVVVVVIVVVIVCTY